MQHPYPSRRQVLAGLGGLAALPALPVLPAAVRSGGRLGDRRGRRSAPAVGGDPAALLAAVRTGDLAAVRRLLAAEPALAATRDSAGRSAFVLAHLAGHTEVAAALRAEDLVLDAEECVFAEDWDRLRTLADDDPELCARLQSTGGTLLHAGALAGSLDLWRLRQHGCDPDAAPRGGSGFTPPRAALECRSPEGARMALTDLLGNGSDPNAAQRGGDSVLHGAVLRRDEQLLRLAVRKGSDADHRDDHGRTPLELAEVLGWQRGVALLRDVAALPRDHRASRFAFDANRQPVRRPDLGDVRQEIQSRITGSSHNALDRVRELVGTDRRRVFSMSTDDELAIEAAAHMGNHAIIRFHLDHGAPLSLPTAVSLGDFDFVRFLLDRDPVLVHERGAHDFPVAWYSAIGGAGVEMAELLRGRGVSVDQESLGVTLLHWCVVRGNADLAQWCIEAGADLHAVGYKWDRGGQTPLQLAQARGAAEIAALLRDAAKRG